MVPPIALPVSGDESPNALLSPAWSHPRRSLSSGARNSSYATMRSLSLRDNLINRAEKFNRRALATFEKMSVLQRILTGCALLAAFVFGILFLVFNERIFGWLEPFAQRWKNTTGGWTILWAITFLAAFPPMIGYSTCCTTAGFVYGIWEGWFILATATTVGSTVSFIVSRTVLRGYVERMVANDKRFAALTLTLKQDGLKLLWMIRLCPLPYSFTNGAMSTFPTVEPSMYALATALITPKLFIHVFIGSRLAAIAKSGGEMSAGDRALNYASIAIGAAIGAFTGWYIYRKTMARAKELEAEEAAAIRNALRRTGMPPRQFSDDPETQAAVDTLIRDDDGVDFFDDDAVEREGYRDEEQTDEEDVFGKSDGDGDGDEEETIGLRKHSK